MLAERSLTRLNGGEKGKKRSTWWYSINIMSFKEKKLSDRLKSQEQHTMENYVKPFVSLPGGSHSWSPHRFHAHK